MKTLDEVIDAMERCSIPHYFDCKGCPYEDDTAETGCRPEDRDADVLHYLKVLQKMQKAQPVTKGEWDELYNSPLTWDELQQMEGKPVLVEEYDPIDDNKGWHRCRWYLVNFVNDEYFYVCDNDGEENHFCLAEIGKTWKAYRKERK